MSQSHDLQYAIETKGLTKTFGNSNAVNGIDLRVPRGSVFGFLGPNGSGKTTTIRMLLGLASISAGEVSLLGHPVPRGLAEALPKVGALVEGPAFYPYLSGRDNLVRFDSADRHADSRTRARRVEAALARVGLLQAAKKKVHAYSLGMKQRLGIANALLQPRDLLVLDEPTNGLDPQGTREVRNLIRTLASEGITIFISSHLLAEIEQICTHLAVMSQGTIVAQGSVEELSATEEMTLTLRTTQIDIALELLKKVGIDAVLDGNIVSAPLTPDHLAAEKIVDLLVNGGVGIRSFTVQAPTLEERFVLLTGEGFEVAQ
jgi:ABC-type multidrug transport system ATPase subunit